MSAFKKTFLAKIYSPTISGTTTSGIISTISDFGFTGFTWDINAGLGETTIRLPRRFHSFGEGSDVAMFNQFDIYINDRESGQYGYLLYSGYIVEYSPVLDNADEYVDVTVWGYPTEFTMKMLETPVDSTIAYASQDPTTILKDVLNRYDGKIGYTASSIDTTSTTVSYTFKQNTIQEAIDKCVQMAPAYWYWRVGPDNILHFHARQTDTINHTLTIGKDIRTIKATRSAKDMRNGIYFLGGGAPVYIKSNRTTSQSAYGKKIHRQQDERVTVQSTATTIAQTYLDFYDHPLITLEVTVVDSNGDSGGYDIELFQPGQVVKIIDPLEDPSITLWDQAIWDIDDWDFPLSSVAGVPLQIRSIRYTLDEATLELAYEAPDFAKRIEDIARNLEQNRTQSTPDTPTAV